MDSLANLLAAIVLLGSTGVLCVATPAVASDRVELNIRAPDRSTGAAQLSVKGTSGRYDRIFGDQLVIPLTLSAQLRDAGSAHKILSADVYLKPGNGDVARSLSAFEGERPVRNLALDKRFNFSIEPNGQAAQDAIALCNGRPDAAHASQPQILELPVSVTWRVTTGRFNFQWTNYDRVAPTDEILNNRDFYADRATALAETTANLAVLCEPLNAAVAVNSSPAAAKTTPPELKSPVDPVQTTLLRSSPSATTASLSSGQIPVCDGGMVRRSGNSTQSYLCLCPGNTRRVETAANAFACEKGVSRR